MNESAAWIPVFRKTTTALLWALFVLIGVLQMKGVRAGFLTGYGADVVAPALLYVVTREGKSLLRFMALRPGRTVRVAAGVFALSVAWEICQKLHWIPGVFDPLDIGAYGVGVLVPFAIDRWLAHKENSE